MEKKIMIELDRKYTIKQFIISNILAGMVIAFILMTLIATKFWLSICLAIGLILIVKKIKKTSKIIQKAMKNERYVYMS
jgi:F0F1-type ATP synthase assembly protein I